MTPALLAVTAGFGMGLSLIVAIGAQNAFVLQQGIRREAVLLVVAICAVSDAVLIALGVGGMGAVVAARPGAVASAGLVGGAFLVGYGVLAARRSLRPGSALTSRTAAASGGELIPTAASGGELIPAAASGGRAALTCLALTWLNPHVYLDTVLLLGTVAAGRGRFGWAFGAGAAVASLCWFTGLGFGARLLSGLFARPVAWRVLDALVAVTMLVLGTGLLVSAS
jgi:L-lysine exporter family protein LysE/ArgO